MCQMERRNITNEFLKECIADALIKLLQEKPMENISISEITDLAGVGRSTYYRNFTSKEDILSFKLHLLGKRWTQEEGVSDSSDIKLVLEKACHYLYEIRNLLNIFYQNGQIHIICSTMYDLVGPAETDNKKDKYLKAGLSFFSFGIIFQWLKDGMQESAEELAQMVLDMSNDIINKHTL